MTFHTRSSTYQIARAPTGLAHCRGCKRRVEKGELRISIGAFVRPGRSCRLVRCCGCIDAKFAHAVLAVYGTATRVPAGAGASAADVAAVRAQLETQAKAGLEPQRPASPSLRLALEGRREHEPAHYTFPGHPCTPLSVNTLYSIPLHSSCPEHSKRVKTL